MNKIKKILFILSPSERLHSYLLCIMILIMALLDMVGVASILPFMAVLTNPEIIESNIILNMLFQSSSKIGVQNYQNFIFLLGVIVFVMLIFSLMFRALTTYAQLRFGLMREYSIGKRLIEGYLKQPYEWFLNHHSADLGKTILSEVSMVMGNGINPLLEFIAKFSISIFLITLLIITDTKLALMVGGILGTIYVLIFYFVRNKLKKIGQVRLLNNELRFLAVSEAFGAIKEVKLGGFEKSYIEKFSNSAFKYSGTSLFSTVLQLMPRFILEGIAFGGVMLVILYLMARSGGFNEALPIISLYVFAGYRLIPSMQQAYSAISQLTYVGPSLDALYNQLIDFKSSNLNQNLEIISLEKSITLKNVYYKYPKALRTALKNINLSVPAKSTVGIVGTTGSGKTTTVDIILGLLQPQKGTLEIDGQIINRSNSRAWQRSIGYVPQHIYLSDDTVEANVAFGISPDSIDRRAVKKASKIANLHDFVSNELPKSYKTKIGERGVRLSGGQRQRIGIARALYHNPKVLVLDEATSALDDQTEQAVMDALENLDKNMTVILIAHRLNTIKNCDIIYRFENGKIVSKNLK
jgi:ABC-type multidrug transport system fused ATPase/permease subunit